MAENQLNRQLAAGIRAAQQGDRERARELLEGVLRRDRNNEQGWIWMSAVVDSQRERRLSLERVIKINPNNQAAQEALNSMVGVLGGGEQADIDYAAISAAARTPVPVSRRGSGGARAGAQQSEGTTNYIPFLIGAAIVVGLLLVGSIFLPALLQGEPTATPTPTFVPEVTIENLGPTIDPNIPTATLTLTPTATFDGSLADLITNTPLGATFTPTEPPPPTEPPEPTATLPALDNYNFLLLAIQGSANPGIYRLDGNGAGLANIFPDVDDFDYDPRSGLIVFTRRIFVEQPTLAPSPTREPATAAPTSNSPVSTQTSGGGLVIQGNSAGLPDIEQYQMFITNINSTDEVTEVTSSSLPSAFAPAISPDGRYIAFTTNIDGNAEIYLYNVGTGLSSRVTDNAVATDIDPDWLPDGSALIFSSDRVSAGNNDLFTIDPFASDPEATVEQVVEGRGRNILPQWSPRGTLIAYLNINSDETTVRLASPDGSSVRDITFNPDWDYSNPSWTPDGNYVIYSSGPPNSPLELRVYSPTTRTEQTIRTINLSVLGVMPR